MSNCPICTTEYVDGSVECSNCGWDLTIEIDLQNSNSLPHAFGPEENTSKILTSIQKVWNKAQTSKNLSSDTTQLQKLEYNVIREKQKLEAANEEIKKISQERDDLKKKLEQHEGKYQQKPLDESSEQKEVLRQSIQRIYKLETSDK